MPPLLHGQAEARGLRRSHRPLRASLRAAQEPLTSGAGDTAPLGREQRGALVRARLAALARAHLDVEVSVDSVTELGAGGAAVIVDGRAIVDPGDGAIGLGAALAWASRFGAARLDLLVEPSDTQDPALLARVAGQFDPAPTVWRIEAPALVAVDPAPYPASLVPPPSSAEQVLLLEQAGLEAVVEGGEVLGELRGLEVARVVPTGDGGAQLQVGVGRFDREAFALMNPDLSPPQALARAIEQVAPHRTPGAEPHPIGRLARERWLRHQLVHAPEAIGLSRLVPAEAPTLRKGLRESAIAVAIGHRGDGSDLSVVVTSVGVDLEAVPAAADARNWHAPDAELLLVVPTGDAHPVTRSLADRLVRPARVVEVDPEWSR